LIYLRVLVCSLLISLFISCTTNIKNYGYIPTKSELDTLIIGKDSKESVIKKVGLPATAGLEGSFYYVRSTFNEPGFRSAQLIDRTIVLLSFDKQNLLRNVETFSVDKETVVRLDYRVTETGLPNKNIFQQIIGSISGPSASSLGL
jgi:outer membrane protein assembly factor BamE (lipoprotein component of BamABCDE complex)